MAILTYDPASADQPEFNEAEQEALAVGEAHAEQEQQLLAGKFEDAEALEQAYIELQKKLGSNNEEEPNEDGEELRDEEEASEEEVSPAQERIAAASEEWEQNGQLSEETIAEHAIMTGRTATLSVMSPKCSKSWLASTGWPKL